jgi:uncharacterized protein
MVLLDVNVVFYAHRAEYAQHQVSLQWLEGLLSSGDIFVATNATLSAVVRLSTNHRWLDKPSTPEQVFSFCNEVRNSPGWIDLSPGPRHWEIFERLCLASNVRGDLVPDAFLAALAIEHDCELISFDRGFRRFPGVRVSAPRG